MTPNRWRLVQSIFTEAVDLLPLQERSAFLEEACGEDAELRRQVDALIDADAHLPAVLEATVEDLAELLLERRPEVLTDQQIGAYRVVREIGRGGMGTVYLAERSDGQFDQTVALKVIRRGLHDEDIRRRFLSERRILALLEHPGIARLYDGGYTDDGRPYLVMEYVDGQSIDAYCDQRRLTVTERLRLFLTVCEAVQYAHQNLVVHRDLKPNNILIDNDGRTRLLDFGIAKLLDDRTETPGLTRTGMRVMTPEYAAPEQVQGLQVTTATDVYALGMVLYELLTGRRPYQVSGKSIADAERTIVEEEPARPSTVVGKSTLTWRNDGASETVPPEIVSAARRTSVVRLRRGLRGDLDRILLKALRKEPMRRYASADAFLDDIRRHLEGLPVRARPDTVGYRMRKFVRRNRVTVAAAGLVLCSLAAGLGAALWQAEQARRERDTAREVSTFLEELFGAADPFAASQSERFDTLRIRDFLQHGAERVRRDLLDQPDLQARLFFTLGRVNQRLGLYKEARPLLEQAVEQQRADLGDDHLETLASLTTLAGVLEDDGNFDEAEPLYRKLLETYQQVHGDDHPQIAVIMNELALVLKAEGQFDEAEGLHRSALTINRKALDPIDPALAISVNMLASLLMEQGKNAEAEPLFRESLAIRREVHGGDHPNVAIGLNNLGVLLRDEGRYDEAEPLIREALDINRRVLGSEHPHVADNLSNLGSVLRNKGNYEAAEPILRESVELGRKLYGDRHPSISIKLDTYAALHRVMGNYDVAERLELEAISIAREAFGDEHYAVAITTSRLAGIVFDIGDYARAEQISREAHARMQHHFPDDHPSVVLARVRLAESLAALGRHEAAEPMLIESFDALRESQGVEHRHTQGVLHTLIEFYDKRDRPDRAAFYRELQVDAES